MAKRKKEKGPVVDKVKILRFGTGKRYDPQTTFTFNTQQYDADSELEHQLHVSGMSSGLWLDLNDAELKKFKKFVASL